ncbi:MAG: Spo0B domain-containing protein [Syntrophomonadaceae bacterium]
MDAEYMVGLLRRMRHDFANHLQVISGYLQLGQPGQVQDYLQSLMEGLDAERIIFKSLPAPACLYFYDQLLQAYDLGITLRFEDIELESWEILKTNGEPGASLQFIRELNHGGEDQPVYLSIYEEADGIDLFYSCGDGGDATRVFRIDKG